MAFQARPATDERPADHVQSDRRHWPAVRSTELSLLAGEDWRGPTPPGLVSRRGSRGGVSQPAHAMMVERRESAALRADRIRQERKSGRRAHRPKELFDRHPACAARRRRRQSAAADQDFAILAIQTQSAGIVSRNCVKKSLLYVYHAPGLSGPLAERPTRAGPIRCGLKGMCMTGVVGRCTGCPELSHRRARTHLPAASTNDPDRLPRARGSCAMSDCLHGGRIDLLQAILHLLSGADVLHGSAHDTFSRDPTANTLTHPSMICGDSMAPQRWPDRRLTHDLHDPERLPHTRRPRGAARSRRAMRIRSSSKRSPRSQSKSSPHGVLAPWRLRAALAGKTQ
jgi:hypothetical protein